MTRKQMTQAEWVLDLLEGGMKLTPMDAFSEHGITRLAARVHELRRDGFEIETEMIEVRNRFGMKCNVAQYSRG